MSGLARLNELAAADAERELLTCCGSRAWARRMAAARPFRHEAALLDAADATWWALDEADWRALPYQLGGTVVAEVWVAGQREVHCG